MIDVHEIGRNIYPIIITTINVVILVVLSFSFRTHYIGRKYDVNFHSRMLILCTCLLLANTFAFITSLYSYIILQRHIPEILSFGRFADRYAMLFAYMVLNKITQR